MQNTITSNRLTYRPLVEADGDILAPIMSDADHLRFSQPMVLPEDQQRYIWQLSSQWQRFGFGCWLISHTSSQELVGWGGIVLDEEEPGWGPELIYYLAPEQCGSGYATELAQTAVSFAFEQLDLAVVTAFAHPQNIASNRVLEKVGFIDQGFVESLNRRHYGFTRTAFKGEEDG